MKVTVCIGSSCHVKGSRDVVKVFKSLISENNLSDKVELSGAFCMNKCESGVCVSIDDTVYSVTPESAQEFFLKNILERA